MRVDGKYGVGYILVSVVGQGFFPTWVFAHEVSEIKHFVLVKEKLLSHLFAQGNPLFLSLDHRKYRRFQL